MIPLLHFSVVSRVIVPNFFAFHFSPVIVSVINNAKYKFAFEQVNAFSVTNDIKMRIVGHIQLLIVNRTKSSSISTRIFQ